MNQDQWNEEPKPKFKIVKNPKHARRVRRVSDNIAFASSESLEEQNVSIIGLSKDTPELPPEETKEIAPKSPMALSVQASQQTSNDFCLSISIPKDGALPSPMCTPGKPRQSVRQANHRSLPLEPDKLVLRASFPTVGLSACVAVKVLKNATIGDVISTAISELKLNEKKAEIVAKYNFIALNEDGMVLESHTCVKSCGLSPMETIVIKPQNDADDEKLSTDLTKVSSQVLDTETVHRSFTKAGYLKMKTLNKHWCMEKKRWVVLKDRTLYYFATPRNVYSLGSLDLEHATVTFYLDNPKLCNFFHVCLFCGKAYQFQCDSKEEVMAWRCAIFSIAPDEMSEQGGSEFQEAIIVSCVQYKKERRWIALSQDKRVSIFNSPADKKELTGINLLNSKVTFDSSKCEIIFTGYSQRIKVFIKSQEDFGAWKEYIHKDLGDNAEEKADLYQNLDFTTGVLKSGVLYKKKIKKEALSFSGWKKRYIVVKGNKLYYFSLLERSVPIGVFDLVHSKVELLKEEPFWKMSLITLGAEYAFASLDPKNTSDINSWYEVLSSQTVSVPYNVVLRSHVTNDFTWTGDDPTSVFVLGKVIGRGGYATVYRASHRDTGFVLAIKKMSAENKRETMLRSLQREIDVLKKCRSSNIVSYYGSYITEKELWIMMDYCEAGSIKDILGRLLAAFSTFTEEQIRYVCCETLKGLIYLHSISIIHLDIKAGNILATSRGEIKLADFGVARPLSEGREEGGDYAGSPLYMSPEILHHSGYDSKTDIWSLGITAIEIVEGRPPNSDVKTFDALCGRYDRGELPALRPSGMCSEALCEFVASCLVYDASKRPSAVELVNSSIFSTLPTRDCFLPLCKQRRAHSRACSVNPTVAKQHTETRASYREKRVTASHLKKGYKESSGDEKGER